jgi:hypothetical protein
MSWRLRLLGIRGIYPLKSISLFYFNAARQSLANSAFPGRARERGNFRDSAIEKESYRSKPWNNLIHFNPQILTIDFQIHPIELFETLVAASIP